MAQADGSVTIDTKMNNEALEKGFERLKSDAESLGITCEKAGDKIKAAFADYDVSANIQNAVAKLQEAQNKLQIATDYLHDAVAMDDDKSAEAWARKREAAYAQVENAQWRLTQVIAAEANKQAKEEEKAQKKATKTAEREAAKKKKAQEKAYKEATKGAKKFANRFSRILSGALIFNALSSGLRQLTSYFGTALKKNSEFASSFAQLKGAFLTAVQPIYEVVAPALIYLMNLLTRVMQVVGRFFSLLTGKSSSQMAQNAKNLYDQANATEAAGNAAEEAKKQIMGFDEINKLDDSSSSSGGGGGSSSGDIAANFEQTEIPEVDLDKMITYTSGALLALGVLLTFSGVNIPLGLGLIAIGAAGLAAEIAANWDSMDTEVGNAINIVLGTLAAAGLVIGAILAFSGANIPLGIGLMVLGAAALGTAVALNWETIKTALQGPIGKVVALVSTALLAIGAILAFTGVALPLGIGLIAAGAVGLATVTALNWDSIVSSLRGTTGKIVAIASGALLALGIILCATGVGIPLGVALIAAGAAGLVTVAALNWGSILEKIKSVWGSITNWFDTYVKPKLTLSYWQEKLSVIGEAIVNIGKNAVNGAISLINSALQTITNGVNSLFQLLSFNINIPGLGSIGMNLPQFSAPQIPYLAQGAVIPPNKQFLAVLGDQKHGTNVEAPLDTIKQAVAEVLRQQGATGEIDVNVNFDGNMAELIRILAPKITVYQRNTARAKGV